MGETGTGFFGRLGSFLDTFGAGGLLIVITATLIVIAITLWRGTGVMLFILFLSYSVGAIERGGLASMAALIRWGCLILLIIGLFKNFTIPRSSMFLLVFYALLGFLFIVRSPVFVWSLQRAVLLLATIVCVSIGTNSYISSIEKIEKLFKMGIIAAFVWTVVCSLFVQEYMQSAYGAFAAATSRTVEVAGAGLAWAGAFFAPMIVWGIIQKKSKLWRIFCTLLFAPFVFILLLANVRTALFGMLFIASLPILFFTIKPTRLIGTTVVVAALVVISMVAISIMMPAKAQMLFERMFSTSTTGRVERWFAGLKWCVERAAFAGFGIGSAETSVLLLGAGFHNAYLTIWYNTGFIGLLVMLTFLVVYALRSFRLICKKQTREMSEFSRIFFGYILGITAIGMFEDAFAGSGGIAVSMLVIVASLIDKLDNIVEYEFNGAYLIDDNYSECNQYELQEGDYQENAQILY